MSVSRVKLNPPICALEQNMKLDMDQLKIWLRSLKTLYALSQVYTACIMYIRWKAIGHTQRFLPSIGKIKEAM